MKNSLIIVFLLICVASGAQTFEKYYPYWWKGKSYVVITYTDGYAMAGFSAEGVYGSKLFIIRTDLKGDTLWTRHFDFEDTSIFPYISSYTMDDDANIYLGVIYAGARSIIKMSPGWDTIWCRQYDSFSEVNQIVFSKDKHLLVSTIEQNFIHRMYKLDLDGNIIWQSKRLNHQNEPGRSYRYSPSILEMDDNRIVLISVLSGWFGEFTASDIYTFSEAGDSISYAYLGGSVLCDTYLYENALFSLYHTTGSTLQFLNFLIKFLPDGTILWKKELAMAKTCYSYRFLPVNGDKLIAVGVIGYTDPQDKINSDKLNSDGITGLYEPEDQIFLHQMTINGDSLWTTYMGDSQEIWPYDIKQCADKGFVITGVSKILGKDTPLLIKTDSTGNITTIGINEKTDQSKIRIYPNPANEFVVFEVEVGTRHVVSLPGNQSKSGNRQSISITDIYGRKVAEMPATGEKTVWLTGEVKPGVYLFQFGNEKSIKSGKIVIGR
jgi:hypothetical protein